MQPLRYLVPSPSPLGFIGLRICLQLTLRVWTRFSIRALGLPCCVTPSFVAVAGGIGISTDCPSPTPFGLGLGPGLPWADEPSPGSLRLSAGRILTCLFAYLYRHYHFLPVHSSLRYCFHPTGTLPYQPGGRRPEIGCRIFLHSLLGLLSFPTSNLWPLTSKFHGFGAVLEPRYILGARPLDQ